jgi:hypothetical protein
MTKQVLIEAQYLPPIAYFSALVNCTEIIVEKYEHYEKQTFRNRCYINSAQGKEALIVPLTSKSGKTVISVVRIDYHQKWLNNHWRTIQTAYGKAPFFEHYAEDLHKVLFQRSEFLYDLNLSLLTMCLKWLRWDLPIRESLAYESEAAGGIVDLRSAINPKKTDNLARFYKPAAYDQVFGSKFVENLSLIDLIFCEGPGARGIVQASTPK